VRLAEDVLWRTSKRGLVVSVPDGDAALLEHPHACRLPEFLADDPDAATLAARLGGADGDRLVAELVDAGVLTADAEGEPPATARRDRRVVLTRSGLEVTGIERPARWIDRHILPLLCSWPGRLVLAAVVVAGVVSVLSGRPAGPAVTDRPVVDALVGFVVGLLLAALHELAHAVALVHFGRRPRRAGFGFYWGGISFFVDSTEAMTLPRRARVVQALAGLVVDVVTLSLLAVTAQVSSSVLVAGVAWRLVVLGLLELVTNLLPVLEVDGHWALADHLDEPDLAPRARAAFADALRGASRPGTPRWMAVYGGVTLVGGLALLAGGTYVWWTAFDDLLGSLFAGDLAEVVVGVLLVTPVALGALVSSLGLLLQALVREDTGPVAAGAEPAASVDRAVS
jgi:putative peptide zinc metalloprotease protein